MSTSDSSFLKSIKIPLIFLGIFVLLIAISAEVDWFWVEESPLSYVFLFGILLPLVFILGWIIMHRFPEKIQDPKPIEGDRKKFICPS